MIGCFVLKTNLNPKKNITNNNNNCVAFVSVLFLFIYLFFLVESLDLPIPEQPPSNFFAGTFVWFV